MCSPIRGGEDMDDLMPDPTSVGGYAAGRGDYGAVCRRDGGHDEVPRRARWRLVADAVEEEQLGAGEVDRVGQSCATAGRPMDRHAATRRLQALAAASGMLMPTVHPIPSVTPS
jgi:hypothetical protein